MHDKNMTPLQRQMPREVQRRAYRRLPETCDQLRDELHQAQQEIMADLDIDPADVAVVDAAMSRAFQRIRDKVTQKLRDEQMSLLLELFQGEQDV